jgi:phage tail-like protein
MPEAAPAPARTSQSRDPYRAYNFKLEIQGVSQGHFTECTGLGIKIGDIKYREGGTSQTVLRLPGPVDYGDVTLRYGLTSTTELWNWFKTALAGKVERRNVSVVMLDSDGVTEVLRWNLVNAWPSQWRGAPLDALGNEAAIETLTLVFESLDRA